MGNFGVTSRAGSLHGNKIVVRQLIISLLKTSILTSSILLFGVAETTGAVHAAVALRMCASLLHRAKPHSPAPFVFLARSLSLRHDEHRSPAEAPTRKRPLPKRHVKWNDRCGAPPRTSTYVRCRIRAVSAKTCPRGVSICRPTRTCFTVIRCVLHSLKSSAPRRILPSCHHPQSQGVYSLAYPLMYSRVFSPGVLPASASTFAWRCSATQPLTRRRSLFAFS